MKSVVTKAVATGGIALAALGIGAGVASADPVGHNPAPAQQQQAPQPQQQQQAPQPQQQQHAPQQQAPAPSPHGFWFFGTWVPLP
ncbi:hypothetical protein OPAG_01044 [Rhodococcus opacus PD630]|uniref:hypothetical protein n=1 Tax=Rhodococcus opacus TaxID=37919 RepID=UPI00029CB00A|nr:hypothetical protein [Rhodococcus opacus]EHI40212.1 hypothetical protein OPAG_01044 [Rhodococcus opacus PD630]UDG96096.1 hypothetical protein K2Z90_006284 [Rhodococcus opacus PD630]